MQLRIDHEAGRGDRYPAPKQDTRPSHTAPGMFWTPIVPHFDPSPSATLGSPVCDIISPPGVGLTGFFFIIKREPTMEKTSGMNIIPISINVPNQVVGLTKQSFFSLPPVSIIITWASPLKTESLFSPFAVS